MTFNSTLYVLHSNKASSLTMMRLDPGKTESKCCKKHHGLTLWLWFHDTFTFCWIQRTLKILGKMLGKILTITTITGCHSCYWLSQLLLAVTAITGCHGCYWLSQLLLAVTAVTGCHSCYWLSRLLLAVTAVTGCHSCCFHESPRPPQASLTLRMTDDITIMTLWLWCS